MKRRRAIVLYEFFQNQDIEEFEGKIRSLISSNMLPACSMLLVMVDHKGLVASKGQMIKERVRSSEDLLRVRKDL